MQQVKRRTSILVKEPKPPLAPNARVPLRWTDPVTARKPLDLADLWRTKQ